MMSVEGLPNAGGEDALRWSNLAKLPELENGKPQSYAEKTVNEIREKFDKILNQRMGDVENTKRRIVDIEEKIASTSDEWRVEQYEQQKRNRQRTLRIQESFVEFARIPTVEDIEYRTLVRKKFAESVREAVPDELPLVFHGAGNIGVVRQIIRTHGLKTPEQRGESMMSFASQIDVTSKVNVQTSCRFAEPGLFYMPYGAIFAFMPKLEEETAVREAEMNGSTEVYGGVDGVDFREEPERLFGIITTPENIEVMRQWCNDAGLDDKKVLTHGEFLESICDYRADGEE